MTHDEWKLQASPTPLEDQCVQCGKEGASEAPCPYQDEINNDPTTCLCCDKCRQECVWEI